MTAIDLAKDVQTYERLVRMMGEYELDISSDAWNSLFVRDRLQEHWQELTSEQQEQVVLADAVLCSKHEMVSEILPVDDAEEERQRGHWWWLLDEGPQVRERIGKE